MHVISRKKLNAFANDHPDCQTGLAHWFKAMKKGDFSNIERVRAVFPHADKVGELTVFNVGGNKVRIIAAIHYNRKRVYIRYVLTHSEYDLGKWK
ncbi:MAG TPA: type II toxin-antitoxin system HigB family toxin [Terrimicrobiaceae bacterium]|nr:type II toxin-antitoxin system HigB family toxin [Terrimicrobiaceae bacterium]